MSVRDRSFVAWEERVISKEKANRIVHYYLKDTVAGSLLAVVGRETSIRHMTYTISEEFLDYYRCRNTPIDDKKWRVRRDVVKWLVSLVPRRLNIHDSNPQIAESTMAAITNPGIQHAEKEVVARKLKSKDSDIAWLGEASICSQKLKHYPAIFCNGTVIAVHSFVSIMVEEESYYLGYLEDLYEDKKAQKWIKIRWFHNLQEVKCVIPQLDAHPREVFISPHVQVVSAECIDGLAAVLTPNDYEKYASVLPESFVYGAHICSREFKNNKALPFCLSKLQGYYNQAIFNMLSRQNVSHQMVQEEKGSATEDPAKQGTKRIRNHSDKIIEPCPSGISELLPVSPMRKCESTQQKLKIKLPSKGSTGIQVVGAEPESHASFKVGEKIEFLSQDSGIRGCWFKCTVIQAQQQRLNIQYLDVDDVEGPGKLEEWIPAPRAAAPDKLGMRCTGRLTVRPWPLKDSSKSSFQVGDAVDAWWCDGWWEGVVAGFDAPRSDQFHVYFPGENRTMIFPKKNLRKSRDWIDNKWVDIKPKPDIRSLISVGSKSRSSGEASRVASPPEKDIAELDLNKSWSVNDQKGAVFGSASGKKGKSVK